MYERKCTQSILYVVYCIQEKERMKSKGFRNTIKYGNKQIQNRKKEFIWRKIKRVVNV